MATMATDPFFFQRLGTDFQMATGVGTQTVTGLTFTLPIGSYAVSVVVSAVPTGTVSAGTTIFGWSPSGGIATGTLTNCWLGGVPNGSTAFTASATSLTHGSGTTSMLYQAFFDVVITGSSVTFAPAVINGTSADTAILKANSYIRAIKTL